MAYPPPPSNVRLAALTMASTVRVVMSPRLSERNERMVEVEREEKDRLD